MNRKGEPNHMDLYAGMASVLAAFERQGLRPPLKLLVESQTELEAFKQIFYMDMFPPDMTEIDGGVWFGNFEVRVMEG